MQAMVVLLLNLLLSFTVQTTAQQDVCPPWFIPDNSSSTGCSCISELHRYIKCGSDFPLLRLGNCMTYDSENGATEVGPCPYVAHYNITIVDYEFYIQLPDNVSLLNEFMCGPLNREGTLCGKCKDGYGIALYSYTLECSKCWGHGYGWILYFFLELFPITVLYFLVVIFHIKATSSPLSALVFMSQILVYTFRLNLTFHLYIENEVQGLSYVSYVAFQVLLTLCGIWSLDFFRSVIPPFCVSSNINTLHGLALEYLVAFYPIFLIFLTYACIKLHDNNFRPIVWLWKPFHRHFVHFRRRWDSKASIINAFTTFLLLSFSKILFVSFTLLYTFLVSYNYNIASKCVLYYNPTVECHSLEYYAFAALSVCVLVTFVFSPTILLILYPTRLFRRCVSCCGFRRWHALHMFVESFQGQYKDGTNGTRDFRMLSASFLILRILILASFHNYTFWLSAGPQAAVLLCALCFHAVLKPYKTDFRNNVDVLILAVLMVISAELLVLAFDPPTTEPYVTGYALGSTLMLSVPHMVLILYIWYLLAKKVGITQFLKGKYNSLKARVQATRHTSQAEDNMDTGSLPDRVINPGEYEQLSPTANRHTAAEPTDDRMPTNEEPRCLTPVYTYGSIT